MSDDLKLIDELLMDIKGLMRMQTWEEVETHSSVTQAAMNRLREARSSGEMAVITMSLSTYFQQREEPT